LAAPPDLAAVERFAVERLAGALRVAEARLAPVPEDFAGVDVDLRAVVLRLAVERFAVDLRAGFDAVLLPDDADAEPCRSHFPDITRCAASATASAISEPSLVALDIMLVAACEAVSAASRPASRILRRAAGLALIAAAAAARPAASISLLIAALAIRSIVSFDEEDLDDVDFVDDDFDDDDLEERLRGDLAMVTSSVFGKDNLQP